MHKQVEIFEVGPRDGLQNEKRDIPIAEKIALIDLLSRAGFSRIEVASFVSPKWVPQMAGSADVLAGIKRVDGVSYTALTPNMRGGCQSRRDRDIRISVRGVFQGQYKREHCGISGTVQTGGGGGAPYRHAGAGLCVLRDRLPL